MDINAIVQKAKKWALAVRDPIEEHVAQPMRQGVTNLAKDVSELPGRMSEFRKEDAIKMETNNKQLEDGQYQKRQEFLAKPKSDREDKFYKTLGAYDNPSNEDIKNQLTSILGNIDTKAMGGEEAKLEGAKKIYEQVILPILKNTPLINKN